MLSGLFATACCNDAASPIASMACGACDTSNACVEDAGADNKTDLRDVSCVKYPHVPNRVRCRLVVLRGMSSAVRDASTPFDQFSKQSLSFRWLTLLVECGTRAGHTGSKTEPPAAKRSRSDAAMVKAGDAIPDVKVHAGSSVPPTKQPPRNSRDVVARGLRHEPKATVARRT